MRHFIIILIIFGLFVLLVMGLRYATDEEDKQKQILTGQCRDKYINTVTYKLVSIGNDFEKFNSSKSQGSFGGAFLFVIGSMGGSLNSESHTDYNYVIKYAYEDEYGIKLMTEKITNDSNIRIKEIKGTEARLIISYEGQFKNGNPFDSRDCTANTIRQILEIPEGTIVKQMNVKL